MKNYTEGKNTVYRFLTNELDNYQLKPDIDEQQRLF